MSHARQQVRERIGTILTTASVAPVISQSRVYPLPATTTTAVLIYTNTETVSETTLTAPRKFTRELNVIIECIVRSISNLDDAMDTLCASIEDAIGADHTLTGLVKDCILVSTEISHDFSGDAPIGNARLQYRVMYRTAETDADVIIS